MYADVRCAADVRAAFLTVPWHDGSLAGAFAAAASALKCARRGRAWQALGRPCLKDRWLACFPQMTVALALKRWHKGSTCPALHRERMRDSRPHLVIACIWGPPQASSAERAFADSRPGGVWCVPCPACRARCTITSSASIWRGRRSSWRRCASRRGEQATVPAGRGLARLCLCTGMLAWCVPGCAWCVAGCAQACWHGVSQGVHGVSRGVHRHAGMVCRGVCRCLLQVSDVGVLCAVL